MFLTTRPVIWVVVLAIGCLLGIGASSAQAQALGSVSPAPVYSYPAQYYYIPVQVYSYPAPAFSAQDYSQPNRSHSYYDQDGIERDSRYPHWSFDTRRARPWGGG
jgi:hypothetical protein